MTEPVVETVNLGPDDAFAAVYRVMSENPQITMSDIARKLDWRLKNGELYYMRVSRVCQRLLAWGCLGWQKPVGYYVIRPPLESDYLAYGRVSVNEKTKQANQDGGFYFRGCYLKNQGDAWTAMRRLASIARKLPPGPVGAFNGSA